MVEKTVWADGAVNLDEPLPEGKVRIQSLMIELTEDRQIHVGWDALDKSDTSYYLFIYNKGKETKLRLSAEAMAAVVLLFDQIDQARRNDGIAELVRVLSEGVWQKVNSEVSV